MILTRTAAVLAAGALLFVGGCSGDDSSKTATTTSTSLPPLTTTEAQTVEYIVRAGERVSGPAELTSKVGDTIKFTIISDADDELHIHGYDKTVPLKSGEFATVEIKTDIPGKFEMELHETGSLVSTLVVNG